MEITKEKTWYAEIRETIKVDDFDGKEKEVVVFRWCPEEPRKALRAYMSHESFSCYSVGFDPLTEYSKEFSSKAMSHNKASEIRNFLEKKIVEYNEELDSLREKYDLHFLISQLGIIQNYFDMEITRKQH